MTTVYKTQEMYNFLIRCRLRFELINGTINHLSYRAKHKVRKKETIWKGVKTNWLSFNLKSFPHLHETRSDIGL